MTDFFNDKVIVLTGASGVIGTHFLRSLNNIPMNNSVVISTYNRALPPHIEALMTDVRFKFIPMDLTDNDHLKRLPRADVIIHAATLSPPQLFLTNKTDTLKVNTTATFALLDKLSVGGTFLYLSTSELYNGLTNVPFKETDIGVIPTDHPRASYIEAKRCGEVICLSSEKNVKIARASLVYGSGTRHNDGRVLYDFVDQALTHGKIVIKGGRENIRTYCYAEDAIDMMWDVVIKGKDVIYNIGGTSVMTITELANKIAIATKTKFSFANKESMHGSPSAVRVDMTKYNDEFGEYKYTSFLEGLSVVIDWQKHLLTTK